MKISLNIFIASIVLFLTSCLGGVENKKIQIDLDNRTASFALSSITDSIKTIALETDSFCLVGKINQLLQDDTLLFLLDKQQKTIFIYSTTGKFLNKIAHVGNAIGEYMVTTSFAIDSHLKRIYLYDIMQSKLLVFGYDGKFAGEHRLGDNCRIVRNIGVLKNGNLVVMTPDYCSQGMDGVWSADSTGKFLKSFSAIPKEHRFSFMPFPYYCCASGVISYYNGFTNQLFTFIDDQPRCMLEFELKQMLPPEYLKLDLGTGEGTGEYYMNSMLAESKNTLYLEFLSNKKGSVHLLYNKLSRQMVMADSLMIDVASTQRVSKIFSGDETDLIAVHYGDNPALNPTLNLLYLKMGW